MRFPVSALFLCLLVSVAPGLAKSKAAPNVLLISLDTLRADHVGINGYHRDTTPFLDELAKKGTNFTNAFVNANGTDASHTTILTSQYPETHTVSMFIDEDGAKRRIRTIPESVPMVQEILKEGGYKTIAVTDGGWVSAYVGFDRGFDDFDETNEDIMMSVGRLTETIEKHRAKDDRPIFAFYHTYQIHSPYTPPDRYKERFGKFESEIRPVNEVLATLCPEKADTLTDSDWDFLRAMYDGEIAYADDAMRWLFERLEKIGFLENTLVVITADHGEEFGEHGACLHGDSLHDELLRVPMILSGAGVPSGRTIDRMVSSVDIVPTILDAAGIETDHPLEGTSLLDSRRSKKEIIFAQQSSIVYTVRTPKWKLIAWKDWPLELYDLRNDPAEKKNVAEKFPDKAESLNKMLVAWQKERAARREEGAEATLTEEQLERLRSLGYVN